MSSLRLAASAVALVSLVPCAFAQSFERIDVSSAGVPSNIPAFDAAMSADGRFVAFSTRASNLVAGDVANSPDVFLRDRQLGTTTRIYSGPVTSFGDWYVRFSADGTKIGIEWQSWETPGPRLVYNRVTQTTQPISTVFASFNVDGLSADGAFAAVTLAQTPKTVYRIQVATGTSLPCSVDLQDYVVAGSRSSISGNGRYVCFSSTNNGIVANDTNQKEDVFVRDFQTGTTVCVSVDPTGLPSNGTSKEAKISADGRYVVFVSDATNIVAGDTSISVDMFVRDLLLGTTRYASLDNAQAQFASGPSGAFLSADGGAVVFVSTEQVSPSDSLTFTWDVFHRDLQRNITRAISPGSPTFGRDCVTRGISADGRKVLTMTSQPTTVGADGPGCYLFDLGAPCSVTTYCTANVNSTGHAATISVQGEPSRLVDNLVISASGMPSDAIALLYSGNGSVVPGTPFGLGRQCVGGTFVRHGVLHAVAGHVADAQSLNSSEYSAVYAGDTRYYQVLYRDPAAGGSAFNTTNAAAITFCW